MGATADRPPLHPVRHPRDPCHGLRTGRARRAWATFVPRSLAHRTRPVTLLLAGPWPFPHQIPWRAWERAPGLAPQRGTLWQILLAAGRKVGLVGWPRYAQGTWTVATPLAADVAPFSTLDRDLRASLEPALRAQPELAEDARNSFALATALGATAARYAAAEPVDALAIDYTLASHLRPPWTAEDPGTQGEDVLHQAARLLDEQLRTLWMLEGEGTLVVVVSPYGLAPPSSWQRLAQLVGRPRRWRVSPTNSPDGFVLFSGPGVRPGRLRAARLADVTATVLYLLELPVARDMAGRVLLEAVSESRASEMPLRMIPSYPPLPAARSTRHHIEVNAAPRSEIDVATPARNASAFTRPRLQSPQAPRTCRSRPHRRSRPALCSSGALAP